MRGGRTARREANLMVSEKIKAAIEATASLAAGASGDDVVHRYRQHVAKNARRLSGQRRNRVFKRTPRRKERSVYHVAGLDLPAEREFWSERPVGTCPAVSPRYGGSPLNNHRSGYQQP